MCENKEEKKVKLIMSVEKYPCLWDHTDKDYFNRESKDLAWDKICQEVYHNWEACTNKLMKCSELKKKWTNIRDYYRKKVLQEKSDLTGSAAKKSKSYICTYSQLLEFLIPVLLDKKNLEGINSKENSESFQQQNEEQDSEPETAYQDSSEPTSPVVNSNKKRKKKISTKLLTILQQQQEEQRTVNSDEDDDTKFLLSFRSYLKTMDAHQKLDFKMGMLKLVKEVSIGNTSPIYLQCQSPSPPAFHSSSKRKNIPSTSNSKHIVYVPKTSPMYIQSPYQSPSSDHSDQ